MTTRRAARINHGKLDILIAEPGAFYVMDRGYVDFARLYTMHQALAFFVTRAKRHFQFKRRYSRTVDRTTGLRCDQTIVLTGAHTAGDYPEPMRIWNNRPEIFFNFCPVQASEWTLEGGEVYVFAMLVP